MTTPPLSAFTIIITFLIAAASPLLIVTGLGSTSTIAVTYGRNPPAVCGIIAGEPTQRIQCYNNNNGRVLSIKPNVSFESISGGRDLLCGLKSGGFILLCWDTSTFLPKRIYHSNTSRLTDLTVGRSQVCAVQANTGVTLCWRFLSPEVTRKFRTITSGGGFSCGILKSNSRVICWGESEIAAEIQRQFGNLTMLSMAAGESHACGITKRGTLVCEGSNASGQNDVPSHLAFEFSGLAVGANHTCGIRKKNGLVVCWGGGGSKGSEFGTSALKLISFETIQGGLDFTCGLTTENLSVACWGPGWSNNGLISSGSILPLPMVIPGPCVESSCSICGVYPNSDSLCSGSGTICKSCETQLPIPALLPPLSPSLRPNSPSSGSKNRLFWAFVTVGSVGIPAGICSVLYFFWRSGFLGFLHRRIHSGSNNEGTAASAATSVANMPPPLRSSGSSKRENSRTFSRQRSGTSSKHIDRAEEFSLTELSAATDNFSLENKIGAGSFGTVYRGRLGDGRQVAIKRGEIGARTKKFQEKEIAFDSELALLSRLHHKHLVELVGFCQENEERLLVYEYMSNGALHDHLHSKSNLEKSSSVLNSWKMRIKIALDAARGIEYLHNYAVPPIIHRDIKSSNILLDANWMAKVSDFGLSLMRPEPDQESMSTKAVGTVGYIDPEYYVLNILTAKSDVYSLGVVLLELLTGKRAVFRDEGSNPLGVVEFAVPQIVAGQLLSVIDKRVGPPSMDEAEAVELVASTALSCVNLEGKVRPTIADIVVNLERAQALCGSCIS